MKKIIKSTVITTCLMSLCLYGVYKAPLRYGNTVFSMNDKKNDDYGSGNIKYPTNLSDKEGLFDITKFEVECNNKNVILKYTMAQMNNSYDNTNGFSHLLLDTYISVNEEGLLTTLEYGAAVTFNEDYPWMYHVRITPEEYYIEKIIDIEHKITERVECELDVKDNTIYISTLKENMDENLKESKYYVFSGGYDVLGSDKYRVVGADENEWYFSGGIDSLYQPNVIDIVNPVQKSILTYFMAPTYAVLSPVYNQIHQMLFRKELLYALTILLFGIKYAIIGKDLIKEKKVKDDEDVIEENATVDDEDNTN